MAWAADRTTQHTGRPAMRSPGRPAPPREVEREFWRLIATGISSEDAATAVGVSAPVGSRWVRTLGHRVGRRGRVRRPANDPEMLRQARHSVAMANASDEVRAACRIVTESHDADGVLSQLTRWFEMEST